MIPKKTVKITFGSGSLEGSFGIDQVTLGDPNSRNNSLLVENYTFGLVKKQAVFSGSFDAIVGLAYQSMAEDGVTPFFDNLIENEVLHDDDGNPQNIFAFYMSTN
jgi:hypothetical protein